MNLRGLRQSAVEHVAAGVTLAAALAALLAACGGGGSGPSDFVKRLTTVDQGKPYIGMSKAEVVSCAGQPHSRYSPAAGSETLVYYYSGAGPVPSGGGAPDKKKRKLFSTSSTKPGKDAWTCSASLVFEGEKLVRVSYAHKDVRSPYAWQSEKNEDRAEKMRQEGVPTCNFSLPRCPRS